MFARLRDAVLRYRTANGRPYNEAKGVPHMIEPVEQAIERANVYYLVLLIILIGMSILCFFMVKKKASMMIYGIALAIWAVVILTTSFLPFAVDCSNSDIEVVECVYINSVREESKSPSSIMGIYSVKLLIDDQTIDVSTVPLSKSYFPTGEYMVKAYYTENSKDLLCIEVIE